MQGDQRQRVERNFGIDEDELTFLTKPRVHAAHRVGDSSLDSLMTKGRMAVKNSQHHA
jgi:hypothetical protein